MANATAITIHDLIANAETPAPTPDVLDTGSSPVTIRTDDVSDFGRTVVVVTNNAVAALTVKVSAGETPLAWLATGDYTSPAIAQDASVYIGPFESAKYSQLDGSLELTFTPGAVIDATVLALRLPVA